MPQHRRFFPLAHATLWLIMSVNGAAVYCCLAQTEVQDEPPTTVGEATTPMLTPLAANDRIVFFGDSLTAQGKLPKGYVTLVEKAIKAARPGSQVVIINAGIGGNKVTDLQKRLTRDVLQHQPSKVVVYIGINDVWQSIRNTQTSIEDYQAGLRDVIQRIVASGAEVLLCTPSVIGEKNDGTNPLDPMLDEYAEISRRVAAAESIPLLDLRKAFVDDLKLHNEDNKDKGLLTTDGVHFTDAGNEFVARAMLVALGVESQP